MLACIIEFGVRPGREAEHQAWLARLLAKVGTIDGFISKEAFQSRSDPAKVITISMWRDAESLARWNADPDHIAGMAAGKAIFSHYRIQIAEIQRDYGFRGDAPSDTPSDTPSSEAGDRQPSA